MALNICYEALIRSFLVILKIAYENWFYTLGFIVFAAITHKSPWLQGMVGWFANLVSDMTLVLSFAGPLAFIFSLIAKVAIKSAFSVITGFVWMMIVLMGKGHILLKIAASPIFFMAGVAWGFFPIPAPLSVVLPYFFKEEKLANGVCIAALAGFLLFGILGSSYLCEGLNWMALQLQ